MSREVREPSDAPEVQGPADAERVRGQDPRQLRVPRARPEALERGDAEVIGNETEDLAVCPLVAHRVCDRRDNEPGPERAHDALGALILHEVSVDKRAGEETTGPCPSSAVLAVP